MRAYPMILAALLLAGCGSDAPSAPPNERKPVFDDQLQAIDKAKAVEADVLEGKQRRDEEIEVAEGG